MLLRQQTMKYKRKEFFMRIQLSDHFTYGKLLRFVFPAIVTMIFTSVYSIVDGLFVSNFVGKTSFAALNLIFPLLMILGAVGFMVGSGGSAIIGKVLGEKKQDLANQYFSLLVIATFLCGIVFSVIGQLFTRQIAVFLGAKGAMIEECVVYARILLGSLPFFMLQYVFQLFFVVAEKSKLGLGITVFSGIVNIILDALFIVVFRWGLAGAAAATAVGQVIGGAWPVWYFIRKNDSLLRFSKTSFYGRVLLKTVTNGSSELLSNIAASIVTMLYNYQLMRLAGEDGVAAYGVIAYIAFIFAAIFIGYASGSAPLISYNYGAGNKTELKNVFYKGMLFHLIAGVVMTVFAIAVSKPLIHLFVRSDSQLFALTLHGLKLYSISFLICGFNIYASAFFTALNNGVASATISTLRTLVFGSGSILILPQIWGIDGIWLAITVAEMLSIFVSAAFVVCNRKKYHYM